MVRVDPQLRDKNEMEWISRGSRGESIGVDVTAEGLSIWAFYYGDYPGDPGGMNCDVGPVFIPWAELDQVRELTREKGRGQ